MQRFLVVFLLVVLVLPVDAGAAFPEDFDVLREASVQEEPQHEEEVEFFRSTPPPFPFNAFLPHQEVTRAEFVAEIVRRVYPKGMEGCFLSLSPSNYVLLFADVAKDSPHGEALCIAMRTGLIRGYSDATFRPNKPINFAEASKVLTKAYGLSTDVQTRQAWYQPYVDTMRRYGVLPQIDDLALPVTRADLSSMLSKLE